MPPKSKPIKNTPNASLEDETSLDCEAHFSLKLKKVEPKLPFYLILAYVLFTTLFSQNHLFLALREAFFLFFGE